MDIMINNSSTKILVNCFLNMYQTCLNMLYLIPITTLWDTGLLYYYFVHILDKAGEDKMKQLENSRVGTQIWICL